MGTFCKPTSIFISNTPHSYVIHSPPSSSVRRLTVKLPTLALKFSQSRNISRHFEWELKNPYQCANNKIHSTTNTVAKHIFISSLHLLPNTKKSSEFCITPPSSTWAQARIHSIRCQNFTNATSKSFEW